MAKKIKKNKITKQKKETVKKIIKEPTKELKKEPKKNAGKFSFKVFSDFVNANFSLIILLVMAFILGFLSGSLWRENKILKEGNVGNQLATADEIATANAQKQLESVPAFDPTTDHFRGNKDAEVVLIEYSDFECPYCNAFHSTMLDLMTKYSGQIAWVYRYYPLTFHPNAQTLAEAGECISVYSGEDAFWKFVDSTYAKMADQTIYGADVKSGVVSEETILSLAVAAGADQDKVKTCLDNKEMTQKVQAIQASGTNAGISGTPSTIIISKKAGYELVVGAAPLATMETTLEKHL